MYQDMAKDNQLDPLFRNAARIMWGQHALSHEEPAVIEATLSDLLNPQAPFHFAAQELIGLAMVKSGNIGRAREIFQALADAPQAPGALRARASELLLTFPES